MGDAVPRPMDPGAILPFDIEAHSLVDLQCIVIGAWSPDDSLSDLFTGRFGTDGDFLRLDLVVRGLVNPPGSADPFAFDPFRYGDHPVYGFVEIDMDRDVQTGGELDAPEYRYLGNVVRFGGNVLRSEFRDRVALDGTAFDHEFLTPPFVERHGEEFHLALLGGQFSTGDREEIIGDGDGIFENGETWNIKGPFFHRAHGYEPFSFIKGGPYAGVYAPDVDLQFRHDRVDNVTYLSLVFPVTNVGAGLMYDEPPEPVNRDPSDHASVYEALLDLQLSALMLEILPTGLPEEDIIAGWAEHDPIDHLDPGAWSITAILGGSYTLPHPTDVHFLWTDIYPNVVPGDVDGSGARDGRDAQLIGEHIAQEDPLDGVVDGIATIIAFATDFSVYDVNYDGVVDAMDLASLDPDGDSDQDGDVDLEDFADFQRCFGSTGSPIPLCDPLDLVRDQQVDLEDIAAFHARFSGPQR